MQDRRFLRWASVAVGALAFGCESAPRDLTGLKIPTRPGFDEVQVPPLQPGVVIVCKDTPAGTSGSFQIDAYITNPDGTTPSRGGFVQSGTCVPYWNSLIDPLVRVQENIDNGTPGFVLQGITEITTDGGTVQLTPDQTASCTIDATRGCIFVFHNVPNGGVCTDQNASNFGGPLPCVYPPPQVCTDQNATNFGGPLPCIYAGKSFTIGPSSMEGAIRIDAGDWVNGGYSFKFVSAHSATTYTVSSYVTISGPCRNSAGQLTGTSDVLTVPMGTVNYNIPASANATDWLPTGDANNVLSWEGSIVAPATICGGGGNSLDASKGAVYHATVAQNPPSGSLVDFRFKYRDPAAKGKPNTNCLDTSDPNRARADVCGASWSQTVRDP
jgi:hypothetical protein